ncbi:MAG: hypothetical protein WD468_06245, partial [Pirellulales bacterium]
PIAGSNWRGRAGIIRPTVVEEGRAQPQRECYGDDSKRRQMHAVASREGEAECIATAKPRCFKRRRLPLQAPRSPCFTMNPARSEVPPGVAFGQQIAPLACGQLAAPSAAKSATFTGTAELTVICQPVVRGLGLLRR